MENIIEINNLTYSYNKKLIFNNLNLEIKQNTFTSIIGSNNSGKTTLGKILVGIIDNDFNIIINKINMNKKNKENIRKNIGYIPNNINESIIMDTVLDEILLSNPNASKKEINLLLEEFKLEDKINDNPRNLSGGEKQLMYIISVLIRHPKLIILDDAFSMLDNLSKYKIMNKLKKISKENNITIVNITNDTEDTIYGDMIAILNNGKIIINDRKEIVLNNESLFKSLNLKIPFMVDLSQKLKYYNLVDILEFNMDSMVNKLWK